MQSTAPSGRALPAQLTRKGSALLRRAEAAVLEVGLGGRLDSTNVCLPLLSVLTSISYDHTRILGDRLAGIAREKAGIVKPDRPVVSGATVPEARAVIGHPLPRTLAD